MYNHASIVSMNELREKAKIMNVTPMCQEHEGENCHRHIIKELTGAYIQVLSEKTK
jgi:hypothetical protein